MRLIKNCPIEDCKKPLVLKSSFKTQDQSTRFNFYKCGHIFDESALRFTKPLVLDSTDNLLHARNYQVEGVDFIYNGHDDNPAGFNTYIGDQMRLGKTVQVLLALASAKKNGDDRFPALIILKPANIFQWMREIKKWYSQSRLSCFPITSQDGFIPVGMDTYIISMDLIGRKGRCKACNHMYERHDDTSGRCNMKVGKGKSAPTCDCRQFQPSGDSMVEKLLELGLKVVVVDEAHSFKNADAARTRGLISFLHNIAQHELEQDYTFTCPFTHETNELLAKYGLSDSASADDILRAMKLQALKNHPDHGGTSESFQEYNKDRKTITDLVLSGAHDRTKITWTEKITIQINDRNTLKTIHKSSRCPVCNAYVSMSAQAEVHHRQACGLVLLSGTAIINNAEEYFVPLNLLAPDKVPSLARFRRDWLIQDHNGKFSRVNPYRLDQFRKFVEPYVLRREHSDVYKDLPPLNRNFTIVTVEDETLKKLYNQTLDKIEEDMLKSNFARGTSIGEIAILRQICGLAKTKFAAEMIEESLEGAAPYTKYAIGMHHHVVKDSLQLAFGSPIQTLTGLDDAKEKDRIMRQFMTSPERVCAINMLAGGVGMDFWYVENVLILERQWSSAYEDQFEMRFYNPDKPMVSARMNEWLGNEIWPIEREKVTNVEYLVAKGTIDEFFYDLVENKRDILHETIDNNWKVETEPGTWKQLIQRTLSNRL